MATFKPSDRAKVLVGPLFTGKAFSATTPGEKNAIMKSWCEALEEFTPDEIAGAFKSFNRSGETFPQPGDIIKLANRARLELSAQIAAEILANQRGQSDPEEPRIHPKRVQKVMQEIFADG